MNYTVEITAEAMDRIRIQAQYIDERAPLEAARWLLRVLAEADTLQCMPRRCAIAPEDADRPYEIRMLNIDGYLLLFTIDESERAVRVLSARHGRQLPDPAAVGLSPPPKVGPPTVHSHHGVVERPPRRAHPAVGGAGVRCPL